METRLEMTLKSGKLVREPSEALIRVLETEIHSDEVIVSLLETASDEQLRGGSARVWVALTDQRALSLAAVEQGDSTATAADPSTVVHRSRLGRDEITIGDKTYKCPMFKGGSLFKQFAQFAAFQRLERLRHAAQQRLDEENPDAAVVLADAGLDHEQDPTLLTLRVLALFAAGRYTDLRPAMTALVTGDRELTHWDELFKAIGEDNRALWLLYQSATEQDIAANIRTRLTHLLTTPPKDALGAELVITMEADEGKLDEALDRAITWRNNGTVTPKTFIKVCSILEGAGLNTELLHRMRATSLAEIGKVKEALQASSQALARRESVKSLRIHADLLGRAGRPEDAVTALEKVLEQGHDDAWIRSKLGEGYEARGQLDEAVTAREIALEKLYESAADPEQAASERRALARLHRKLANEGNSAEREVRLACADLLDRGLDWAARLTDSPPRVFAGQTITTTVEILAARRIQGGTAIARLNFEEEIFDPRIEFDDPLQPPTLLKGGIAGVWPSPKIEHDVVQTGKKTARVRYAIGEQRTVELENPLLRGLHLVDVTISVPSDVRPTYLGERVRGQLELELSPPGALFPLHVALCHAPLNTNNQRSEEREGSGRLQIRARIPDASWSLGDTGEAHLDARLTAERIPTKIEATLIATERLRPPHKGERVVESWTWTFPIFPYEVDSGKISRTLRLDLPQEGMTTGLWTWFEVLWSLQIRLLRKERPEASVEVPLFLRYPPLNTSADQALKLAPSETQAPVPALESLGYTDVNGNQRKS